VVTMITNYLGSQLLNLLDHTILSDRPTQHVSLLHRLDFFLKIN